MLIKATFLLKTRKPSGQIVNHNKECFNLRPILSSREVDLFISLLHRTSQRKAIIKGEGELDV